MDFLFSVLFALNLGMAAYFAASAKSNAKPWLMFAWGILTVCVGFGFEQSVAWLAARAPAGTISSLESLAKLANYVCAAMAGGLISTAVANRAKLLNDKELKALLEEKRTLQDKLDKALEIAGNAQSNNSDDPGDKALAASREMHAFDIASRTSDRLDENERKIDRISP